MQLDPNDQVIANPNFLGKVINATIAWLDPADAADRVVYGIVTVGAVIAVESANSMAPSHDIEATILVLVVYWMAHAYSALMGHVFRTKEPWSWNLVLHAIGDESAIMRGASLPILAMVVALIVSGSSTTVTWSGLGMVIFLLVGMQAVAGIRASMKGFALIGQMFIGFGFGIALILVKVLLG